MERGMIQNPNMGLRWTVLFTILLNVAFSYFSYYLPNIKTQEAVTAQYYSMFTPAPFTFSIWGVIYASFIVYGIAQLLGAERGKWIYDHLAGPVMFIQVLSILWIMAYGYELMTTSMAILVFMLGGGIAAYGRAKQSMINPAYSRFLTVPFSLFLGWMCVAVIAGAAIFLRSLDLSFSDKAMVNLTGLMITVAFLLAVVLSLVFHDWIIPIVVAWAFYGIRAANLGFNDAIAELAMIGTVVLGLWGLGYGLYRSAKLRQFMHNYRQLHTNKVSHRM